MLEFDSLNALHDEPSASNRAIRVEPNLAEAEMSGSAIVANALILLRRAADTDGLKLNRHRQPVPRCGRGNVRIMEWPGYDKDELFGLHKVINEPDFLPLHFIRVLTQAAKLFRTYRGKLVMTPLGRKILEGEQHGPLQALLFHVAFWRLNLGYFDRYALDTWPQNEVGVVLWSLSASAHDWLPRETLTRLCASPVIGVLESQWDFGSTAMEARILRPLWWFDLLEARSQEKSETEFVGLRRPRFFGQRDKLKANRSKGA